jgi:hypothetical protein
MKKAYCWVRLAVGVEERVQTLVNFAEKVSVDTC